MVQAYSQYLSADGSMLTITQVLLCAVVLYTASAEIPILNLNEGAVCDRDGSTCKAMLDCPKAKRDLNMTDKLPVVCNYRGEHPVVCCEPTTTDVTPEVPGAKSKKMCMKYAESVLTRGLDELGDGYYIVDHCFQPFTGLTIGGLSSAPKEFTHMALIGYDSRYNKQWNCGGSLISERFVLSAAHCSSFNNNHARWVVLGEYNRRLQEDDNQGYAQATTYEIIERINHPGYKPPSLYNDIALYRLNRDVEFNEYIRPICLQTDYAVSERTAITIGWGQTHLHGPVSDVLQKVDVPLTSKERCAKYHRGTSSQLPHGILDATMFCAGNRTHDSCQGDSGGPLLQNLADPYCMNIQIGVISFGDMCASKPGVYTRVSYYIPWIESIVWP